MMAQVETGSAADLELTPEIMAQGERLAALAQRIIDGETTMKAELDLKPEELETMYATAYNQYVNKRYKEALEAFCLLLIFDPMDYRFILGAAGCLQMAGQLEMAVLSYLQASAVNQTAPGPFLYMAECLLKLNDREGAHFALNKVLELSGDSPTWAAYRNQAEVMLENLAS